MTQILPALLDWGYTMGKVKVKEGAIDSTRMEAKKRGEGVGIDGHKRRKGTKGHVWVNPEGVPLSVAVGPGKEPDRCQLEEVLGGFRVKKGGRGRARRRPRVVEGEAA
ncbi:transposase [Thermoflexus hugenholtzii]